MKLIEKTPIGKLVFWSLGLGLCVLALGGNLGTAIFAENPPAIFMGFIYVLTCVIGSIGGIASIIKREIPGGIKGTISGPYAVFSGWLWVAFCLAGILLSIVMIVSEIRK